MRSVRVFEKNADENRPQTAEILEIYVLLFRKINREDEAVKLELCLSFLR